jgi:hypothetical protein
VKFSKQQDLAYQQSLAAAKATDAQSRKTLALTLVSERYGGVAQHLAETTATGKFRTFRQELHQLEVTIGLALLPTLGNAAKGLGDFFAQLRERLGCERGEDGGRGIHDVLRELRPSVSSGRRHRDRQDSRHQIHRGRLRDLGWRSAPHHRDCSSSRESRPSAS